MKIRILQGIEGAKQATGVAVIIDVFRAFTVETYLMKNRASKIIPVGDLDFVYKYQKNHPDVMLIGERNGKILPGFHYGNSPFDVDQVDFCGKTILHTTSAGTQGIANAKGADTIITGALVNAKAIAQYILKNQFDEVSLVCMGLGGIEETEEDTLCAKYIESLLLGNELDISKEILQLRYTSGAKFFDETQIDFPMEDFAYCTQLNIFNFVLEVVKDELPYVKRVDVA
ncbi:MAG: 2-phosphosulfolactate phosphatase [Erysipelotrichaceae bacterium]|nr:2-phosphosulfolactate phosphatase [Erysipelotrichaceae bacterium]